MRSCRPRRVARHPASGGDPAAREFQNIGEFLSAVRFRPSDQRLDFVEGVGAESDENGLSAEMRMDNDRQGGFMVPEQFRPTIMSVSPQDAPCGRGRT